MDWPARVSILLKLEANRNAYLAYNRLASSFSRGELPPSDRLTGGSIKHPVPTRLIHPQFVNRAIGSDLSATNVTVTARIIIPEEEEAKLGLMGAPSLRSEKPQRPPKIA